MAIKEQDKVFYEVADNGDKVINLPVTRANNVEGLGRSASTAYVVGDVVYVDNNKKVALKCTTAGTTSSSELDVSTASIGNVITDGTVKWKLCNRTSDVTSVNGKTGDVVVGEVTNLSISGKTITVTFADGTTKTLTTQDTNTNNISATSLAQNGYVKLNNGFIIQWGLLTGGSNGMRTVTFPTAFASACYVVQSNMQSVGNDSGVGSERNPTDVTTTSFKVYYNTPVSWIAVGK